jgi:DNA polymerase-3 subunit epsilon
MFQSFFKNIFSGRIQTEESYPEFFKLYLEKFKNPLEKNLPFCNCTFAVIDTETTGININHDKLISFGGLLLSNDVINLSDTISFYFRNVDKQNRDAIQIHGTLPNQSNGLEEYEAIEKIVSFIENHIIIGHHIGFDVKMINTLLQKHNLPPLQNRMIDTNHLKNRIENSPLFHFSNSEKAYSLDEICKEYDIQTHHRHTAAGDAFLTALAFIKMARTLELRGVNTLQDLLK